VADRYRTLTFDSLTRRFVAEVELAGLNYSWSLSDIGEASGILTLPAQAPPVDLLTLDIATEGGQPILVESAGLPVYDASASEARRSAADELIAAVAEWRRLLVIERDGTPLWGGPIWATPGVDQLTVQAFESMSYYRRRHQDTRLVFLGTDVADAVRAILAAANAKPNGSIGITIAAGTIGVTVDRTYEPHELVEVAKAIDDMAKADPGFDWRVDLAYASTGDLIQTLRMARRLGRPYQQTGFTFEVGRDIDPDSFEWPSDGAGTNTRVIGTGAGTAAEQLRATYQNSELLSAGFPMLEEVLSLGDETSLAQLQARTRARLNATAQPIVLPEISVPADPEPGTAPSLGSYIPGDGVLLTAPADLLPRHPRGLEVVARVADVQVAVSDDGDEDVKLTLIAEV
jgi:hypothetical protein